MNRHLFASVAVWTALAGLAIEARADASSDALSKQAYSILMSQCYRCHGSQKRGFDASLRDSMVSADGQYIVPNDLENSQIWTRVAVYEDMPPKGNPEKLTAEDREVLKQWILSGAEFPAPETPRNVLDETYILKSIDQHLGSLPPQNWKHQRYFSLVHLYNNPKFTDYHLRLYRAALSKVINSLSREPEIVLPRAIDPQQAIFNIDLREVGWTESGQWLQVLQEYPYGIQSGEPTVRNLMKAVLERLGRFENFIPYVRADWFIVEASRPPLYDTLLKLPDTEDKLLEELGVQFKRDFEEDRLARAAFTASGVSRHNRLIDRLTGRNTRYYYRSHDFGKSFDRALLSRFPLGPKFEGNTFADFAYEQDGGEIVFRLANGMQGYMIVNGKGERLSEAPVTVVRDLTEISGSPTVVNGVSCIGCHATGIQAYQDNVRQFVRLGGDEGNKVNQLYRDNEQLLKLQESDRRQFMEALELAVGPFLKQGEDAQRSLKDFPEPVREVAFRYEGGVGLEEAAYELGVDPGKLSSDLNSVALQNLGLGPLLAKDNRIPRDMWDSRADRGVSLFQAVSRELGSTPLSIPKQ
jgi:serine/threonine-protein kinase